MGADADAQCNTDDGQRSSTAAVLAGRATTLPETAAGRDEPSGPCRAGGCRPSWTAGGPCMSTGFAAQTVEGRLVVGVAFYSPLMRSSRSTTPCRP